MFDPLLILVIIGPGALCIAVCVGMYLRILWACFKLGWNGGDK